MSRFVLNFCVRCDFESSAGVPGFLLCSAQDRLWNRNGGKKIKGKSCHCWDLAVWKANVEALEGRREKNKGHHICCV